MKNLAFLIFLSLPALAETNLELVERLAQNEKYGKVVQVFTKPSQQTKFYVEYSFPEMALKPNDTLYFYVPEGHSLQPLSQVSFAHRQSGSAVAHDYNPGLTSALIYTHDMPHDPLRYWAGFSSGKLGAKYAEYRRSPEEDSLFEWPLKGHIGVTTKEKSKDLIHAHALRIQNVGKDIVLFSKASLETLPSSSDHEETLVFTPNSDFGDSESMQGRVYGGGQKLQGTFPSALRLSSYTHKFYPKLPSNYRVDKNQLFITMKKGTRLNIIQVMCGDSHPDKVKNENNGWGSLGTARITISVVNSLTGESRVLLKSKNVPPEGVISASDINMPTSFKDGDEIVITNDLNKSTLYIMALKIGMNHEN